MRFRRTGLEVGEVFDLSSSLHFNIEISSATLAQVKNAQWL